MLRHPRCRSGSSTPDAGRAGPQQQQARGGAGPGSHLLLEARQLVAEGLESHARFLQLLPRGAGGLVVLVGAQLGAVELDGPRQRCEGPAAGRETPPPPAAPRRAPLPRTLAW